MHPRPKTFTEYTATDPTMKCVVFGMDRLPRLAPEVLAHLPILPCGSEPMRLNSAPVSAPFFPPGRGLDHADRLEWTRRWLLSFCGDYNPVAAGFIEAYLDQTATHVAENAAALERVLEKYHGLYRAEDCVWSVLRPLGRVWFLDGDKILARADVGFWDGRRFHGFVNGVTATDEDDFTLTPLSTTSTQSLARRFLELSVGQEPLSFIPGDSLPVSPFRREIAKPPFAAKATGKCTGAYT